MGNRTGFRISGRLFACLAGGMVMMGTASATVTYGYVGSYTTVTDGVYQSGQQQSQLNASFTFTDALVIGVNNVAPISWSNSFTYQSAAVPSWTLGSVQITVGSNGYISDWSWSATGLGAFARSYGPGSGGYDAWSNGGGYAAGHSLVAGSWPVDPQSVAAVPEPAGVALVGVALAALGLCSPRRRRTVIAGPGSSESGHGTDASSTL